MPHQVTFSLRDRVRSRGRGGIRPANASELENKTIDFTSENQSKSYLTGIYLSCTFDL